LGLGAGIFEKPLNVQLSQMVPEIQKTIGIALSQRSSRELSKSFEIFEKSSLSSKIQVLKVGSFSKIPGSRPGFIPDLGENPTNFDKMKKKVCTTFLEGEIKLAKTVRNLGRTYKKAWP